MKGTTKLFRILGIDVKLHWSWWFIFVLLAWSLSISFFPHYYPGLSNQNHWLMGITSSLLLFISVLFHELSHSLVAKAKKIKVDSITLFFFGGIAGITDEEIKPSSELLMSLAGPFFSLFLAGLFFLIFKGNITPILTGIMFYLYQLNLILAVFNLIPGYPLDGGRALRAILHAYFKDLKKATKIASKLGKFFAIVLIFLGLLSMLLGLTNGLWFILLGGFLYFVAGMGFEQVVIKQVLSQIKVKELMDKKYLKVDSQLNFLKMLKKYGKYAQDAFIVQKSKNYLGVLDLKNISKMKPDVQERIKVSQLIIPKSKIKNIPLDADCYQAFKMFSDQKLELLPIGSSDKIKGIIYRKKLMHRLILELKYNLSGKE